MTLILLPVFTFAGLIIDGSRIYAAKIHVSGAGDLAMNAALSDYHVDLHEIYGLFTMSQTTEELQKNISRYFNNTINNANILLQSDSYTRSFINSIGSLFAVGDLRFDNIVDTESESFEITGIPDSVLCNPHVLERQIVDYMKYRAPLSIGKGLLTKFGVFGDTAKQNKAIEAKISYETKLGGVQDAMQQLYDILNTYNIIIDGSALSPNQFPQTVSSVLSEVEANYTKMTEYIIAINSISTPPSNLDTDVYEWNRIAADLNKLPEGATASLYYDTIKGYINNYIILTGSAGNLSIAETDFQKKYLSLSSNPNTFEDESGYLITLQSVFPDYKKLYTHLELLEFYYNIMNDTEKADHKEEYGLLELYKSGMSNQVNKSVNIPKSWKDKANALGSQAQGSLSALLETANDISKLLQKAADSISNVSKQASNLNSARENWSDKVNGLSAGDVKTSMQGDYSNSAKDLNQDAIDALKTALIKNKDFFELFINSLDETRLFGVKISQKQKINYAEKFSEKISAFSLTAQEQIKTYSAEIIKNNLVIPTIDFDISGYEKIDDSKQFYKYLKKVCGSVSGNSSEKKEYQSLKKNLIQAGNDTSSTSSDLSGIKTESIVGTGLTEEINQAIDLLAESSAVPNDLDLSKSKSNPNSKDTDIAEKNKNTLSLISSLITGMENILSGARDAIYMEEYITEMFSCYTSDKDSQGKTITAKTLNHHPLSDNPLFRSEAEYILWGGDTAEKNLNNTKALLFGLRFALNSVYAFTSSDIRTPSLTAATAIAGWTGFGVPIVQTVIILAWSMAESVIDVNNLCAGKAVPIFKNNNTWVLGMSGLKDTVLTAVKEQASKTIEDVFEKINNIAEDKISDAAEYVSNYVEETSQGIVDSAVSAITTPIQQFFTNIVGESNLNLTKEQISSKFSEIINEVRTNIKSESNGIVKEAKLAAVNIVENTYAPQIVNTVFESYSNAKDNLTNGLTEKLESLIKDITDKIKVPIQQKISDTGKWVNDEVASVTKKGETAAKEKIIGILDQYTEKLSGSFGGAAAAAGSNISIDKTTLSSGMTLTYKEYMKLFILLFSINNGSKTAMLTRTAKLIQKNISVKDASFDISKSYTMIQVSATAHIRTTFFDVPVQSGIDSQGNAVYELNFSNIGSGKQNVKYVGVSGY